MQSSHHFRVCARLRGVAAVALVLLAVGGAAAQEAKTVSVAASAICAGVENKQPVGESAQFPAGTEQIYCWTRIANGQGQTIVHAWIHEGTTRARVELEVGSASWRTYSSKRLLPSWTGKWEVKVMTRDGVVLETIPFTVQEDEVSESP